jgi:hypothetical protein
LVVGINGKTIGPLPALRDEFFSASGKPFHMYEADSFLDHASNFLNRRIERTVIDEAKATREDRDAQRRAINEAVRTAEEKLRGLILSSTSAEASLREIAANRVRFPRTDQVANLLRVIAEADDETKRRFLDIKKYIEGDLRARSNAFRALGLTIPSDAEPPAEEQKSDEGKEEGA